MEAGEAELDRPRRGSWQLGRWRPHPERILINRTPSPPDSTHSQSPSACKNQIPLPHPRRSPNFTLPSDGADAQAVGASAAQIGLHADSDSCREGAGSGGALGVPEGGAWLMQARLELHGATHSQAAVSVCSRAHSAALSGGWSDAHLCCCWVLC